MTLQAVERGLDEQSILDYEQAEDGTFNCLKMATINSMIEQVNV